MQAAGHQPAVRWQLDHKGRDRRGFGILDLFLLASFNDTSPLLILNPNPTQG